MKKRKWIVKTENKDYEIQLVSGNKLTIDGLEYKISSLKSKSVLSFITEYELPIEGAKVILSYYVSKYILVVDGKNYDTGKDYVSISNIPIMAYVFMALNAINLFNGVIGLCFALLGISLTLKISCSKMNIVAKLLLNILNLVGMIGIVLILAILLNILIYY